MPVDDQNQDIFPQIRALSSNFCRRTGKTTPPTPTPSLALTTIRLVTRLFWLISNIDTRIPHNENFSISLTISVKFCLSQLKLSSTQSSSCSSLVSLFCPTVIDHKPWQIFDIPKHMQSQTNQIHYQAICRL